MLLLLLHPFYSSLDFVRDYPGELVPEPVWILLKQETVSGSVISWAICNTYILRPPARSPPAGDTLVHLILHSTNNLCFGTHSSFDITNLCFVLLLHNKSSK